MNHTYNIISKYPKGNKLYTTFTIQYQVDNKSDIYEVSMVCLKMDDDFIYAFIQDKDCPVYGIKGKNPKYIETDEDKKQFGNEVKLFQLGRFIQKNTPNKNNNRFKLIYREIS